MLEVANIRAKCWAYTHARFHRIHRGATLDRQYKDQDQPEKKFITDALLSQFPYDRN